MSHVINAKPIDHKSPEPLSDFALRQIHVGLVIPSKDAVISMCSEIRKWRGEEEPDLA